MPFDYVSLMSSDLLDFIIRRYPLLLTSEEGFRVQAHRSHDISLFYTYCYYYRLMLAGFGKRTVDWQRLRYP